MIATKVGDGGYTTLHDRRVPKSDHLIETLGDIDEAISAIVLSIASMQLTPGILGKTIDDLHDISAYLTRYLLKFDRSIRILEMEDLIYSKEIVDFTYPTENLTAAHLNMARAIVRRAERSVIAELPRHPEFEAEDKENIIRYMNRLSDYLFALSLEERNL